MKTLTNILLLLITNSLFAQLEISTVTPDSSSILNITATHESIVIPRMTKTQLKLIGIRV